jgi:fructose-1,6-bisphosphatase/inositol monophosphatase family enzyme
MTTAARIDATKVEDIIRHVAATEVMPRFQNLAAGDIREKNPGDFVTVADEASEKALSQLLRELLPGSDVVGEEAVAKDLRVLEKLKGDAPVWVIDPIDGTYNYSHNRSTFGILVALVHRGITTHGFAYDAPGDRMAVAELGAGATLNGRKTALAQRGNDLAGLVCQGGGAQAWHFDKIRPLFKQVVNHRCSLHDFMDVYTGAADCVVHINRATPWDHAANVLISGEAGGVTTILDGEVYDPSFYGRSYLVTASSTELCRKIYQETAPLLRRR